MLPAVSFAEARKKQIDYYTQAVCFMKISAKTDVGMLRSSNQDTYAAGELPSGGVWAVVCDGMGGHNGGNVASAMASERISDGIRTNFREGMGVSSVKNMLESATVSANIDIFERAQSDEELAGMGTTAVAAVLYDGKCVIAYVGDSRCYLIRNNKVTQVTTDHSLVQELLDAGLITADEAKTHPMKNMITRALGLEDDVTVDFVDGETEKGDMLLLCSDGLSNHISEAEILECIADGQIDSFAQRLIDVANKNGGSDNITAVILAD